jgi:ERCC4-related helicase
MSAVFQPEIGDFLSLRGREWLVQDIDAAEHPHIVRLACVSDDAQGETAEIILDAEIGAAQIDADPWSAIGKNGTDSAPVFAAFLRTLKWKSATAAERDLFQAPFRAGIRLDTYQLLPLRKALRLPRVNLLIADDVGLGKTVEAGLITRELLLRRRIDFILVSAPPSMLLQWQDELATKFGLAFNIIDRDRLAEMRRQRGFGANPWRTGSRFILSHRLLVDETYTAGLREVLGEFRARSLFILDEAHHAAPASGSRYAIDSQFTKALSGLADRFEHRLFLSATPHNGHSNSFSRLLEMLDPQRFLRGMDVRPRDLDRIMVRRLKTDLRRLDPDSFPDRVVEAIPLDAPATEPELQLAEMLRAYGKLRSKRISRLSGGKAASAKLSFIGLQQRLLSSVHAFAKTLAVHRASLVKAIEAAQVQRGPQAASINADAIDTLETQEELPIDLAEEDAEKIIAEDESAVAQATAELGTVDATREELKAELAAVDRMLALAEQSRSRQDARVRWLIDWIRTNMMAATAWNDRRLVIFTEYEDTRRYLERRLKEAFGDSDRGEERIGIFTGATSLDRREEIKRAFNADPAVEPVRILICTDAAREGINLQTRCYDLIHFDLPWNPSRLEQRNGRIDRKLQPAKEVFCRYFVYAERAEDVVLDAIVRKTEVVRRQLGSAGQVIEHRIAKKLEREGITNAAALAKEIEDEDDPERTARARAEMDDDEKARHQRLLRDHEELQKQLEEARTKVGVESSELKQVVAAALQRSGQNFEAARAGTVGNVDTFRFDPAAFASDPTWADAFDDLRERRRKKGERIGDWRRSTQVRSISFEPPRLPDGREASDVVQVHLEHRLVRRLLSRFLSEGFRSDLSRVCAVYGPGAQPRVVLIGRLSVYGDAATRLHEEIIPVTAIWSEAGRPGKKLRALAQAGEATTMQQVEVALKDAKAVAAGILERLTAMTPHDVRDLVPELDARAEAALAEAQKELGKRGSEEAKNLRELLEQQRKRIEAKAAEFDKTYDPNAPMLPGLLQEELAQMRADRRHWNERLARLAGEIESEPARLRQGFEVKAHRLEPVGLLYLWPVTG